MLRDLPLRGRGNLSWYRIDPEQTSIMERSRSVILGWTWSIVASRVSLSVERRSLSPRSSTSLNWYWRIVLHCLYSCTRCVLEQAESLHKIRSASVCFSLHSFAFYPTTFSDPPFGVLRLLYCAFKLKCFGIFREMKV